MNKIDLIESARLRTDVPPFRPGDQVRVHVNIREGGRERIQVFEGVVIARRGGGIRESFTVRKVSFGVGVERTFPLHAPAVAKLEVVRHGKVRRAKLYYLRELTGRRAKIEERRTRIPTWGGEVAPAAEEEAAGEEAAEGADVEVVEADVVEAAETTEPAGTAPEPVADVTPEPVADVAPEPEGAETAAGGTGESAAEQRTEEAERT